MRRKIETGDGRRETGDGTQETVGRRRETGDRRWETGDERQETGGGKQETVEGFSYVISEKFSAHNLADELSMKHLTDSSVTFSVAVVHTVLVVAQYQYMVQQFNDTIKKCVSLDSRPFFSSASLICLGP